MSTPAEQMAALKLASSLSGGNNSALGNTFGGAGNSLGILSGLQQGGVGGYTSAALNAGKLAGRVAQNPTFSSTIGDLANVAGIYQGLEKGGVSGYGGAAANTAQLAGSLLGNTALSTAGGVIAAPISLYNTVENWRSGATGADALNGAETGATIGSDFGPIGTVVGGVIGGAAGALSSAFGPGAKDPETAGVQNVINAVGANPNQAGAITSQVQDPYLGLAGLMDERSSTLPMYQQYGRMGEQSFTNAMTGQINDAFTPGEGIQSGPNKGDVWSIDPKSGDYILTTPSGGTTTVPASQAAAQIYNSDVDPWVSSMGSGWNNVGPTYKDTTQGLLTDMVGQYMSGQAPSDWKAVGGDAPFSNLTPFVGNPNASVPTAAPPSSTVQPNPAGTPRAFAAEGGLMKHKKSALHDLYRSNFADRVPHFDDGGYVNYVTPYSGSDSGSNFSFQLPGANAPASGMNASGVPTDLALPDNSGAYGMGYYNPDAPSFPTPSAGGGGSAAGALSSLQGLAQQYPALQYAALLPLLSSLLGGSGSAKAPATPAGFSSGAISSVGAPTSMPTQNKMNPNTDWYTYGQHPEASFYSNNQLPYIPGYSPASATPQAPAPAAPTPSSPTATIQPIAPGLANRAVMARGGALGHTFDSSQQSYVPDPGHGDGTSDDINAKVSGGEYVMDGGTVSMLGNGSNEAGARKLDQLRQRLRKHAGKQLVKGKQFMKAKEPEQYLNETDSGD